MPGMPGGRSVWISRWSRLTSMMKALTHGMRRGIPCRVWKTRPTSCLALLVRDAGHARRKIGVDFALGEVDFDDEGLDPWDADAGAAGALDFQLRLHVGGFDGAG